MPDPTLTPLAEILPLVLPAVPAAPDYQVTLHLRIAAIEFCERARAWRHVSTKPLTKADSVVVVPPYATIHAIEHAEMGGARLEPVAYTDVEPNSLLAEASPRYITQVTDDRLTVVPFAEGDLTVSLFLKPRFGTAPVGDGTITVDALDVIPTFLYRQYAHALADGALARLHGIPGQAFTDHGLADRHRAMFLDACRAAISGSVRGRQRAPLRSRTEWL